ncbi:MAG: DUF4287 domain-containing protein [Hyphomonadaceae bacterium]|nr:DUF4287 domain-containing protein [Hyphomonadaceae bacterium]
MVDPQKAVATQIANIEKKTGKSLAQLTAAIGKSGLTKHGEVRAWAMEMFKLGHGDAHTLTHVALMSTKATGNSEGDALAEIYAGKRRAFVPSMTS